MNGSDSENTPVGENGQPRKNFAGRRSVEDIVADVRRILSPSSAINVVKSPEVDANKTTSPGVLNAVPLKKQESTSKMDTSSDDEYASADEDIEEEQNRTKVNEGSFVTCVTRISQGSVGTVPDFKECLDDGQILSPDRDFASHVGCDVHKTPVAAAADDCVRDYDNAQLGLDLGLDLEPQDRTVIRKLISRKSVEQVQAYTELADVELEEVPKSADSSFDDLVGRLGQLKLGSGGLDETLVFDKENQVNKWVESSGPVEGEKPIDTTLDRGDDLVDQYVDVLEERAVETSGGKDDEVDQVKLADETFDAVRGEESETDVKQLVLGGSFAAEEEAQALDEVFEQRTGEVQEDEPADKTFDAVNFEAESLRAEVVPELLPGPANSSLSLDVEDAGIEEVKPTDRTFDAVKEEPTNSEETDVVEEVELSEVPTNSEGICVVEDVEQSEVKAEVAIAPCESSKHEEVPGELAVEAVEAVEEPTPLNGTFDAGGREASPVSFDEVVVGLIHLSVQPTEDPAVETSSKFDVIPVGTRHSVEPEVEPEEAEHVKPADTTREIPQEAAEDLYQPAVDEGPVQDSNSFDELPVGRSSVTPEGIFEKQVGGPEEKATDELVEKPSQLVLIDDLPVGPRLSVNSGKSKTPVEETETPSKGSDLDVTFDASSEVDEKALAEQLFYGYEPTNQSTTGLGQKNRTLDVSGLEKNEVIELENKEKGSIDFAAAAVDISNSAFDDIPIAPKAAYSLDFLDDPNFNPFKPVSLDDIPVAPKAAYSLDVLDDPNFNPFKPLTAQKIVVKQKEKSAKFATEEKNEDAERENVVPNFSANPQVPETCEELPITEVAVKPVEAFPEVEKPVEQISGVEPVSGVEQGVEPVLKAKKSVGGAFDLESPAEQSERQSAENAEEQLMSEKTEQDNDEVDANKVPAHVAEADEIPIKKGAYNLDFLEDPSFDPFVPVAVQKPAATPAKMTSSGEPDDGDIPIIPKNPAGGYNLDYLDDPNYNPFGVPPKKNSTNPTGGYNLDMLDDPSFNPFGVPPRGVALSPAPSLNPTSETRGTTDSGVFDELCGSGPPSSSAGVMNGPSSDDGSASGGGSLTSSPQHVISEAPDCMPEDQDEIAAQINCDFKDASSYFLNDPSFVSELEALPVDNKAKVLSRISLFRDFDPLVGDDVMPAPARRESYRRFIRESLGGGDLLSIDSTFSSRAGDKPAKPEPRKSVAPFRAQQVLSPKPEVDNENDDEDAEESCEYYPDADGSASISSSALGDTVLERSRHGKPSLGASSSFSLRKSSGSKMSRNEKQELMEEIERLSKAKDDAVAALNKANLTCEKLTSAVAEANAARDEALAARNEGGSGKEKAEAETNKLRSQLQAVMVELEKEREERLAANAKIQTLQAELEAANKATLESRLEARKLQMSQSQYKEVIKEYEKTMADLLREKDVGGGASAAELKEVKAERDRLRDEIRMKSADLRETEVAFNSIHTKAERLKENLRIYESNESKLKAALEEARLAAVESENVARKMVEAAQEKLEWAKKEVHETKTSKEMETAALKGQLRLSQNELSGAHATIAQKEKEVKELSNIVEELLQSIGASSK